MIYCTLVVKSGYITPTETNAKIASGKILRHLDEPLHFDWDSLGLLLSPQEAQFLVVSQIWSVGQSLPTMHVLPRCSEILKLSLMVVEKK